MGPSAGIKILALSSNLPGKRSKLQQFTGFAQKGEGKRMLTKQIAQTLNIDPEQLEKESLRAYLQNQLRLIESGGGTNR